MPRKARARMLSPSISTSERVNRLPLKAALLYTWLLAHADDQGRMSANPATLKGVVCPLRDDITREDVQHLISEIEDTGLVKLYSASELGEWTWGDVLLQITDWWEYQALRDPKPSRYPPPEGWQDKVGHQRPRDEFGRFANE